MKVTVYDYYPGQLTQEDFYNVTEWYKEDDLNVIMTIEGVKKIEKSSDGLALYVTQQEYNFFDNTEFSHMEINM